MAVYGIWERVRKQWWDCKFELGGGQFTQHRSIARCALIKLDTDTLGFEGCMIERYGLMVCALGEDGLPVLNDKEGGDADNETAEGPDNRKRI